MIQIYYFMLLLHSQIRLSRANLSSSFGLLNHSSFLLYTLFFLSFKFLPLPTPFPLLRPLICALHPPPPTLSGTPAHSVHTTWHRHRLPRPHEKGLFSTSPTHRDRPRLCVSSPLGSTDFPHSSCHAIHAMSLSCRRPTSSCR